MSSGARNGAGCSVRHRVGPRNLSCRSARIRIQFPDDPSNTPLRVIRDKLAEQTGLAADRFKLIKSGAIMKDDSAPLSAYGLTSGATIALMGSAEALDEPAASSFGGASKLSYVKNQPSGPPTEQSTLRAIQTEIESVRKSLQPAVTIFLSSVLPEAGQSNDAAAPVVPTLSREDAKTTHAQLGELLLQALLRLDAIMPESSWNEVRSARKGAVKEVQGLLDLLDDGWRNARFKSDAPDNT